MDKPVSVKHIPIYIKECNTRIGHVDIVWDVIKNEIIKIVPHFKKQYYISNQELKNEYLLTKTCDGKYNQIYSPSVGKIWCTYNIETARIKYSVDLNINKRISI
ncbi:hypothetical protein [Clostridium tyrobutyricum]|uniref:hypothetical protein n=1 Tax=Clostridium tyrobutyricum TaxID=1519 RepID=UPI002B1FE451|nr:hypothetical protein [Clostridium tyrobutyricum]MEA5008209.1 hypothetical protein [Clostridium tyrobutyricum]